MMGDDEGIGIDILRVSQLLTDEYSIKILVATVRQPKSAQDIAAKYGIPIAATYRRIKDLEAAGLLVCQERRLSQQGKRVSYYPSMLKNAYVFFEDGTLKVKFQLKTGGADRFGDEWHEVQLEPGKPDGKSNGGNSSRKEGKEDENQ